MKTTFEVSTPRGEELVTITTRPRTSRGNLIGYWVEVNGGRYFVAALRADEAEARAFARWCKGER